MFYCFKVASFQKRVLERSGLNQFISLNLSRLFHCSVINVLLLLSFLFISDNFCSLSHPLSFVKNFFQLFYFLLSLASRLTTCLSYQTFSYLSTTFFIFFKFVFKLLQLCLNCVPLYLSDECYNIMLISKCQQLFLFF